MNETPLIEVQKLCQYFPVRRGTLFRKGQFLHANEEVSIELYEGETYGLVGESGSGKSTFGRSLLQLLRPTSGSVLYTDSKGVCRDLTKCTQKELRSLRRELQIIFQDPYSSLNPRMTVGQIIEEGVVVHGFYKRGSKELKGYVLDVMKKCGLQGYMAGRYPHQFSGGQRQRICIARALAVKPRFVVCDECVSALDVSVQSQILNLLLELKEKEGLTYLFISHDLSVVRHLSDRIGVMYLGQIVEWGGAEEVFSRPAHPYTKALLSVVPSIEGEQGEPIPLRGEIPSAIDPPSGCPFRTRCYMAREECLKKPPKIELEEGHFSLCHFAQEVYGGKLHKN